MILEYKFSVSKEVSIEPKFRKFFSNKETLSYGNYTFRCDRRQRNAIDYERGIQVMIKQYPEIKMTMRAVAFPGMDDGE